MSGNISKMGLCRGLDYLKGRPTRCLATAFNKHMTPKGEEYFLCERHEDMALEAMAVGGRTLNSLIFGGQSITGVRT